VLVKERQLLEETTMADAQRRDSRVAVTAGLPGASWSPSRMNAALKMTPLVLSTEDGQPAIGLLFARGGEKRVVLSMRPRELLPTHHTVSDVLDSGWAFWVWQPRSIEIDTRLGIALQGDTASVRQLRALGFEQVVRLGDFSAGASSNISRQRRFATHLAADPSAPTHQLTR